MSKKKKLDYSDSRVFLRELRKGLLEAGIPESKIDIPDSTHPNEYVVEFYPLRGRKK